MPAPKGNSNAKGHDGSKAGRLSLRDEFADLQWHDYVWHTEQDIDVLEKKVMSRKYAGRDMAALRLLKGDKTIIAKFMDKLVPNVVQHVDLTSKGEKIGASALDAEDAKQIVKEFEEKYKQLLISKNK